MSAFEISSWKYHYIRQIWLLATSGETLCWHWRKYNWNTWVDWKVFCCPVTRRERHARCSNFRVYFIVILLFTAAILMPRWHAADEWGRSIWYRMVPVFPGWVVFVVGTIIKQRSPKSMVELDTDRSKAPISMILIGTKPQRSMTSIRKCEFSIPKRRKSMKLRKTCREQNIQPTCRKTACSTIIEDFIQKHAVHNLLSAVVRISATSCTY